MRRSTCVPRAAGRRAPAGERLPAACKLAGVAVALAAAAMAPPAWAGTTDLRLVRNRVFRALGNDPNEEILRGSSVVPPSASLASGTASLSADTGANTLSFDITTNVLGETAAHIHGPAYAFENGPALFTLPAGAHKVGVWNFTDAQEAYLVAGQLYIDIHSVAFPAGDIRGQVQCQNAPIAGRLLAVRVVVQNLGPDTYTGIDTPEPRSAGTSNKLMISVDIDEPSKPWPDPGVLVTALREYAVTIAPMDSVELDLGVIGGYYPPAGVSAVASTATAQGVNVDPNASNNSLRNGFGVAREPSAVPALGLLGLAAAGAALAGAGARSFRQRRPMPPGESIPTGGDGGSRT